MAMSDNEEGESLREHRMEINIIDKTLRDIYYNPETGYQSSDKLFRDIQKYNFGINRNGVKRWLEAQPVYTQHKRIIKNHPKRQTWVRDLGEQLQIDLIFMGIENNKSKWAKENDNYGYIVAAIEVISRYGFAIPTKRKESIEVTLETETILIEFHEHFGRYPKFIVSDYGTEFTNNTFKEMLKKYPAEYVKDNEVIEGTIEWFSPKLGRHLAMIERFNRTLKTRIWKSFTANHNREWKDNLPKFISGYNNTIHNKIGIPPANVNKDNASEIWMRVYGGNYAMFPIPKFRVGDTVRLKQFKELIRGGKGLDVNFSPELYIVRKVNRGIPNMYFIKSKTGNKDIPFRFYEQELSFVNDRNGNKQPIYRIEKIVSRDKKSRALVKWEGFDDSHNTWIPLARIENIYPRFEGKVKEEVIKKGIKV